MHTAFLLAAGYVWTQILVPGGTVTSAFGLNDKGQTAVALADGSSGIYRGGHFTPLPAPPAGVVVGATGINNAGVVVGDAFPGGGAVEVGFILHGSTYTFFSRPGWDNTEPRAIGNSGLITGHSNNAAFTSFA